MGTNLGVHIPGALAKELGLHDGSDLDLQQVSVALIMRPIAKGPIEYSLEEMLAQVAPETIHGEKQWANSVGREEW